MEISAAGSAGQIQANVQNQVAMGVLRKSLDIAAQQGSELVKMMNQSSGVGRNLDVLA